MTGLTIVKGHGGPTGAQVTVDRPLFLTAEKDRLVEAGDPDGRFLFCAAGKRVSRTELLRLGVEIVSPDEVIEKVDDEKTEDKSDNASENKSDNASENKSDEDEVDEDEVDEDEVDEDEVDEDEVDEDEVDEDEVDEDEVDEDEVDEDEDELLE